MRIGLTGEATAKAGDLTLALVMNNRAWMAAERIMGRNYLLLLLDLATAAAAKEPPQLGLMSALLYGATRREHRDLTEDDCIDLILEHSEISEALTEAINGSIKLEDRDQGEAAPPVETPADESPSGTGTTL